MKTRVFSCGKWITMVWCKIIAWDKAKCNCSTSIHFSNSNSILTQLDCNRLMRMLIIPINWWVNKSNRISFYNNSTTIAYYSNLLIITRWIIIVTKHQSSITNSDHSCNSSRYLSSSSIKGCHRYPSHINCLHSSKMPCQIACPVFYKTVEFLTLILARCQMDRWCSSSNNHSNITSIWAVYHFNNSHIYSNLRIISHNNKWSASSSSQSIKLVCLWVVV